MNDRAIDDAPGDVDDVGQWHECMCPKCGAPAERRITNLRMVASSGDETLASEEWRTLHMGPGLVVLKEAAVRALGALRWHLQVHGDDGYWYIEQLEAALRACGVDEGILAGAKHRSPARQLRKLIDAFDAWTRSHVPAGAPDGPASPEYQAFLAAMDEARDPERWDGMS